MIFQGIRTSIAKKLYFCDFSGGGLRVGLLLVYSINLLLATVNIYLDWK